MGRRSALTFQHPVLSRREAVQAGAIGLMGFGMNHVAALRAEAMVKSTPKAKNCIFLFLTGGLSQIDSFDMKPEAPDRIRGEFKPIDTATPGEFGRTPGISGSPSYKTPSRNHWGGVQSVFLAGGGVQGGRVIGASDKQGAYPSHTPQRPENFAAMIYHALGIPPTAAWHDASNRPHFVYHDEPIPGLL